MIAVSFDRTLPHNALPALPPSVELESKAVLRKVVSARVALERLNSACRLVPNPAVIMKSIALQEAKTSSEIESIFTTHDELYLALSSQKLPQDPSAKEVLRYQEALWFGFNRVVDGGRLDTPLFIELAQIIKQAPIGVRTKSGTQIVHGATREPVYTPPEGEARITALLDNLAGYWATLDDLDPLVKLAVGHYQFEAIHPFPDGNGRTGRVLNILYLIRSGLLDWPVLYLSRYFIEHRADYYAGLREVTEHGAWEAWILFMLEAIEETSGATERKLGEIRDLVEDSARYAREHAPKIYSKELLSLIFEQPYVRIPALIERGIAKRQTASVYLQELARIGLLEAVKVGRDMVYINRPLLDTLLR